MKRLIPLASLLVLAVGCATHPGYRDATEVRTYSTRFTHSDYEQMADAMVNSFKSNDNFLENLAAFQAAHPGQKPRIIVTPIENHTRQVLPLDVINDALRTGVINTGLFRFIGNENKMVQRKFNEANGVLVAPGASSGFSNQSGADYLLSGTLTQLDDQGGRTTERTYILTMQLDDLVGGDTVWIDRKPLRKESKRAGLGW